MTGSRGIGRWRYFAALAAALYAAFLVTAPFEHHDLTCHLKTPQHCLSCASSPLGSNPHPPTAFDAVRLDDAGRAVALQYILEGALLTAQASGRSPPSFS
jgi:hypothetical protein